MKLFFAGGQAYTPFRLQQKLQILQTNLAAIQAISAHYWYVIESAVELAPKQIAQLSEILDGAQLINHPTHSSAKLWVVPRLGTISPWSSKAIEIIQHCGLNQIERAERGICFELTGLDSVDEVGWQWVKSKLHDPLIESVITDPAALFSLFQQHQPQPLRVIDILDKGEQALQIANEQLGLALNSVEMDYLLDFFRGQNRNPTDVELMMFAQVNSEHCRHKIFNASWEIDGEQREQSLFAMIRHTYQQSPQRILLAYADNAAVISGTEQVQRLLIDSHTKQYSFVTEAAPIVLKVETHNHPTAISPFPGAATGSGGEIRDEAATGRGSAAKAGIVGFSVSHLHIPNFSQPWETDPGPASGLATALEMMIQGPIGAAAFNNEFGRPNLTGYFRTFGMQVNGAYRGYHKPIMIAGGMGTIRLHHLHKQDLPIGSKLVVLGGPAMAIGLGGGSASSRTSGAGNLDLDFASVQRANPEMQRRCQEVINTCCALGDNNPILSIHDVGAGGLSNALPELVAASKGGAKIDLRAIPNAAPGMTPLEIWCNEAQERFVLAVAGENIAVIEQIAKRERCPLAIVGEVTADTDLILHDLYFNNDPVAMPLSVLFDEMPRAHRVDHSNPLLTNTFTTADIDLAEAIQRVLQFPCVASKKFLITIGDRSVTGLVARDQLVGPWQVPVADCAVTCSDYHGYQGEALAVGERAPIALIHPAAAARMAVGEAITNIAAACIADMSHIALSANWMAAAGHKGEGAGLYAAVQAIALELCPALGIAIPVGKDSLSMAAAWQQSGQSYQVTAPISLVITAAAPVSDVRKTLTPQLRTDLGGSLLLLIDLGESCHYLAGSVLAQCYQQLGDQPPDVDNPELLKNFFQAIQLLNEQQLLMAYHDRSDGGLLATLCEMAFAGHTGIDIALESLGADPIAALFTEELGAVLQVRNSDLPTIFDILKQFQLQPMTHVLGTINEKDQIIISHNNQILYQQSRVYLQCLWSETSYRLQALRDNQQCADQEYETLNDINDPGLNVQLTFDPVQSVITPYIHKKVKPKVAILREQGVNGQMEMAAAFDRAGFVCVDVHMSEILTGQKTLKDFIGLAACGGFSYGDVLGAGRGWAQSILHNPRAYAEFSGFFQRTDTFTLGVCNGCQMLADIKNLIPGANQWPTFRPNFSEQYEARVAMVQIQSSPSIFFKEMMGSCIPIVVAHGEGQAVFDSEHDFSSVNEQQLVSLRYVNNRHQITEQYPANPNGSPQGITGLTTQDGRVMILMPHPERVFRTIQHSWHPDEWGEASPWLRLFENARMWVS